MAGGTRVLKKRDWREEHPREYRKKNTSCLNVSIKGLFKAKRNHSQNLGKSTPQSTYFGVVHEL